MTASLRSELLAMISEANDKEACSLADALRKTGIAAEVSNAAGILLLKLADPADEKDAFKVARVLLVRQNAALIER